MAIFGPLLSSAGVNNMGYGLKMVSLAASVISLFWLIMGLKNYQNRNCTLFVSSLLTRPVALSKPSSAQKQVPSRRGGHIMVNNNKYDHHRYILDTVSDNAELSRWKGKAESKHYAESDRHE